MTESELNDIFGTSKIFDKDSSEYREAFASNEVIKANIDNSSDPLHISLKEATHLDEKTKSRYLEIADMYMMNLKDNIFKNQFELNSLFPGVSIDEWNDFLSDRIVSVYINKHKRTLLKAVAEDNLSTPGAKNKRDNLQLIENLKAQEDSESAKNIVIMRMPDIYQD